MSIVITILPVVAGVIVLLLIIAIFMTKGYKTHSDIIIHAFRQKAFDYIKRIKNQDNFNKWVMVDPDMKREFKGTDGTVGFIYAWNGNKEAGEGEQEIKALAEGNNIETEIRFVRPFAGIAYANMTSESVSDNQTKVTWTTSQYDEISLEHHVTINSKNAGEGYAYQSDHVEKNSGEITENFIATTTASLHKSIHNLTSKVVRFF